ncbi:uncharacterized protein LOC135694796 [Rhopilema esculentum]|uniref:uncharacterized protein LOC135694796 n=1 Tax=Rhopilema esculentum TaxID=499914 RepID=UPI0031DFD8EE
MKLLFACSFLVILLMVDAEADVAAEHIDNWAKDTELSDSTLSNYDDDEFDEELEEETEGDPRPGKNCAGCKRCYRCKFQRGPRTCHKIQRRVCPKCPRNRCYDNMKPPESSRRRSSRRRWGW